MIELLGVSKKYQNNKYAVKNVSITACTGITGLIGLNGAGKSTVIKAVCAEHYVCEGKINISKENTVFDPLENPEQVKRIIGYVPENDIFPEKLTVIEFLYFCAEFYGLYGTEKNSAVFNIINEYSLKDILEKKINTLSKGFRRRLSFAKALIHNPPNIIFDEPLNGLDPVQIVNFRSFIKKAAEKKTVLLSTHLIHEAENLCSKLYIISKGQIAVSGSPLEIKIMYNTENLEEAFFKIIEGQNEM